MGYEEARARIKIGLETEGDDARYERAQKLDEQLRTRRMGTASGSWEMGRDLDYMRRENLWQGMADTWREYVESLGLSQPTENMLRNNYRLYCEEMGFEVDDPRLLRSSETKLALGTRRVFRSWVLGDFERAQSEREPYLEKIADMSSEAQTAAPVRAAELRSQIVDLVDEMNEKVSDYIDLCQTGNDFMSRSDLRIYLEEKVGITRDDEGASLEEAFRTIRKAKDASDELADEEWLEMAEEIRRDEPVMKWLRRLLGENRPATRAMGFLRTHEDKLKLLIERNGGQYGYRRIAEDFGVPQVFALEVSKELREEGWV